MGLIDLNGKNRVDAFSFDLQKVQDLTNMISCEVAVIGGGRWGKIITGILAGFQGISKIHLISNRNFENITEWVDEASYENQALKEKVLVDKYLDHVIENRAIESAFVVNSPHEHYDTTKRLLKAGKHVLAEKPFVLHTVQANELVTLAKEKNLVLAVGLEFMMASYIHHFRNIIKQHAMEAERVRITWHDLFKEQRHGVLKLPDMTVNVFTDIFPHILSILNVLFENKEARIKDISVLEGGGSTAIDLIYGTLPVTVSLSRIDKLAQRIIEVSGQDGRIFKLDFTKEPGEIQLDGEKIAEDDPYRPHLPRALDMELKLFLYETQEKQRKLPFLAEKTLGMVDIVEQGNMVISEKQKALINGYLFKKYPAEPDLEVIVALREYLLLKFLEADLVKSPKDEMGINFWTKKAFLLIHKLSYNPFTTQREALKELQITKDELIKLNAVLQKSPFAQSLILEYGFGVKYWENTIIPLIQSGIVNKNLRNEHSYPHRVGVYVGPYCMFSCSFCGRNPKARYETSTIHQGNELIKKMFQEAPKEDPYRFYISGGLEPLTNDGIGEIVKFASDIGFKLSLYTNGFMLTPPLLKSQPGLWNLDTLRISLYGTNEDSFFNVTKNRHGFKRIIQNAKDFLRLREAHRSSVKFGFNFIILPDSAEHVLEIAELIGRINTESGAGRKIDFLTLREDYSYAENNEPKSESRERLIDIFRKLEKRREKPDLQGLYIDYGYALYGASKGKMSPPLHMVKCSKIRPKGFPQISVVVDLLGDVYLYREAGFIEREGVDRYKIGCISGLQTFDSLIREFVQSGKKIPSKPGDTKYFDAFDHLVTSLLNQLEDDIKFGIPFDMGPVKKRIYTGTKADGVTVGHPTLPVSKE